MRCSEGWFKSAIKSNRGRGKRTYAIEKNVNLFVKWKVGQCNTCCDKICGAVRMVHTELIRGGDCLHGHYPIGNESRKWEVEVGLKFLAVELLEDRTLFICLACENILENLTFIVFFNQKIVSQMMDCLQKSLAGVH